MKTGPRSRGKERGSGSFPVVPQDHRRHESCRRMSSRTPNSFDAQTELSAEKRHCPPLEIEL